MCAAHPHTVASRPGSAARGVRAARADMRNNPGGLLRAGLDVARLWLDGEAAVFNVQGRDEDGRMAVTQVRGWGCVADLLRGEAAVLACTCVSNRVYTRDSDGLAMPHPPSGARGGSGAHTICGGLAGLVTDTSTSEWARFGPLLPQQELGNLPGSLLHVPARCNGEQ